MNLYQLRDKINKLIDDGRGNLSVGVLENNNGFQVLVANRVEIIPCGTDNEMIHPNDLEEYDYTYEVNEHVVIYKGNS